MPNYRRGESAGRTNRPRVGGPRGPNSPNGIPTRAECHFSRGAAVSYGGRMTETPGAGWVEQMMRSFREKLVGGLYGGACALEGEPLHRVMDA